MIAQGKKIAIGSDHAGYEYKEKIKEDLAPLGFTIEDFGTFSTESMDYPDPIHPLSKSVNDGVNDLGIIICGSGNGVAMVANKYPLVRAAVCWNEELTKLARQHNDANVLSLPARFISVQDAVAFVRTFLSTGFEGGRHLRRVEKISHIL